MKLMNFTKTVLGNLFSKPATRLYPEQPRIYPERTRGKIGIEIDVCIFCGLCSKKCPTGAILVDRATKDWTINRFGCIQCGCCVEVCPKKCLHMQTDYPSPAELKHTESHVQESTPVEAQSAEAKGEVKKDQ